MDTNPHLSCVWSEPVDWDALTTAMVPAEPGYYAFTDHSGPLAASGGNANVLYVGIATQSLRKRISKYKTGDTASIAGLHKGGFLMFLSRATAHFHDGKLTHSVQRTPVNYTINSAGQPPQHGVLEPQKFYLRWSVDYRAAIEALLIQQLNPKFNTMLVQD
jgi:hypothetical protein